MPAAAAAGIESFMVRAFLRSGACRSVTRSFRYARGNYIGVEVGDPRQPLLPPAPFDAVAPVGGRRRQLTDPGRVVASQNPRFAADQAAGGEQHPVRRWKSFFELAVEDELPPAAPDGGLAALLPEDVRVR